MLSQVIFVGAGGGDTVQLTDAGKSLVGRIDVGMWRSRGGVRVRRGAARCGQNCGHAGLVRRLD